jgi:hypothetical protein
MTTTELMVNLWAVYDASVGYVYALSGRAYAVEGTDERKLMVLKSLARTDYVTAKRYKIPSRFAIHYPNGDVQQGFAPMSAVTDPNAQLFEEMFQNIEAELPDVLTMSSTELQNVKQVLPADPLCVVTTLYEDEQCDIRPIITDEDREWVRGQERSRGR